MEHDIIIIGFIRSLIIRVSTERFESFKMDESNKLGTESIGRLMLRLSLPAILGQLINALYNIVDRMYIGRIPGEGSLALAGLGVAFPIILIISAFSALVGMGGAPLAAIKMGQKDKEGAERILGNAFVFLVLLSVALTVLFFFVKDPVLLMFGASESTLPYASSYLGIYLAGTIFVQLALGLNSFISTQGFATISMMTVLIGAVANIVLDPIFIFAFHMGVRGAALATVISQAASAVFVLAFLFSKKTELKIHKRHLRIRAKVLLPVMALGVSPFIMQATESLVQLTFNSGMKHYGDDNFVGAMAILFSIMQTITMPIVGLTQGSQPIISYNFGAGRIDRVKKTFRLLLTVSLLLSTTMWAMCLLFPGVFIAMFTKDPALMEIGRFGLRIFMGGVIMLGAQFACQQTLVALGQAKVSTFLALLRKVILLIPLALILPRFWGTTGLFVSEPVADVLAATTTTITFLIVSRRLFRQAQEAPHENAN